MGINPFKQSLDNKYKEGEIVHARECPGIPLIIRRYVNRLYYCRLIDDPEGDELVYYERELVESLKKLS